MSVPPPAPEMANMAKWRKCQLMGPVLGVAWPEGTPCTPTRALGVDAPNTAHGAAEKWTPRVRRASRGPFEECWFGPWGCLPGLLAAWNRLRMGQSGQNGTMKAWEGPTKNGLLGPCTSLTKARELS